jgi:tetratricopeptide (TPR) repeat protein
MTARTSKPTRPRLDAASPGGNGSLRLLAQLARKAEMLARMRHIAEAGDVLREATAVASSCADGDEKAQLLLAEAVFANFNSQNDHHALSRIQAATRYAALHASQDMVAEIEAWTAWICNVSAPTYALGIVSARSALRRASVSAHAARARANFALAAYWHYTDNLNRAQPYYREALHHARANADAQLNTNILRYMALLQVNHVRAHVACGTCKDEDIKQAFVGLASAESVRATFNKESRDTQAALHTAELLRLTGQYEQSAAIFEREITTSIDTISRWELAIARADLAICLWHLGRKDDSRVAMQLALGLLRPQDDTYTHAVVAWNEAQWLKLAGGNTDGSADAAFAKAAGYWDTLRQEQLLLREYLEP